MKKRSIYKVEKPLEDFYKRKSSRDKRRSECKECCKHIRDLNSCSVTVHEKRRPRCLETKKLKSLPEVNLV